MYFLTNVYSLNKRNRHIYLSGTVVDGKNISSWLLPVIMTPNVVQYIQIFTQKRTND